MSTKILSVEEKSQLYEKMCKSVVCLRDKERIVGGGVFVEVNSKQLVLTAAHLVHAKNLRIESSDGRQFRVRIDYIKRDIDIALFDIINKPEDGFQCAKFCKKNKLIRGTEIYLIGHPGSFPFSFNAGSISCGGRTCGDIYEELNIFGRPDFSKTPNQNLIDDFLGLKNSLRLIQAKNIHGGGRVGGTGAPFLDSKGRIVGLYSFTYKEEDFAIHVAEIQQVLLHIVEESMNFHLSVR